MKRVNAIDVRKSLGAVLKELEAGGEPVLVMRRHQPVAALISMEQFRQRFAGHLSRNEVDRQLSEWDRGRATPRNGPDPLQTLRGLRDGAPM